MSGTLGREPIVPLVAQGVPVRIQRSGQLALEAKRQTQINQRVARPERGIQALELGGALKQM